MHLKNLNTSTNTVNMYKCDNCDYKSARMWCINRHSLNRHGTNHIKEQSNQIQSGFGSVVNSTTHIPIEKHNEVVGIAHGWKQQCAVKDNAIRVRDTFLTGNNSKLQDEITKNKILIEQNRNIIEINNELVLEKENLMGDNIHNMINLA